MKRNENEIIAALYECSQVSPSENPSCHNCKYKIVDDEDFPETCLCDYCNFNNECNGSA